MGISLSVENFPYGHRRRFWFSVEIYNCGVRCAWEAVVSHPDDYAAAFRETSFAGADRNCQSLSLTFLAPFHEFFKVAGFAAFIFPKIIPLDPPGRPSPQRIIQIRWHFRKST
jgi:hypothetical protein